MPGCWHPLPGSSPEAAAHPAAPGLYPAGEIRGAEAVPSAGQCVRAHRATETQPWQSDDPHFICSESQTEHCRVFSSPFTLNYSVAEVSKIKDF